MMSSNWFKDAVVYQIYPRSFQDSNNDGIGDLNGIKQRLPYLKKLGVDVLWLNPIYRSPDVDNGYDIADYEAIHPDFGTMDDFEQLLSATHENQMKLLMDLVVNHTSDQHRWFQESKKSQDNPYADYYIWRDPVDGHEPNNWGASFNGSAWTYVPERGQYYLHLFAPEQPDLNWENPEVRQQVYNIMRFWLDKGIDGFRMDVINKISKVPGLPNGPITEGEVYGDGSRFTDNGPRLNEFLQEMNREVLSHYDIMTVGEMPGATPEMARKYSNLDGSELNMIFQFEHVSLAGNPDSRLGKWNDRPVKLSQLKHSLSRWQEGLDGSGWNSLYWNNHDQPRTVSRFATDDPGYRVKAAKMLGTTLHFLQGTPYIYQGEELGMTNVHYTKLEQYEDIESLNAYDEYVKKEKIVKPQTMLKYLSHMSRDNARTPMQWDETQNAGFSEVEPWFALNPNYQEINAKKELLDQDSVFYYYQKLVELRHQCPAIRYGSYQLLDPKDEQVFAYLREYQGTTLLVINNFTAETIERDYDQGKGKLLLDNYPKGELSRLRPYESRVYIL
ncbi:oligo-1,6-glucosidase [Ligilactobacillus pobuzihii E100301 = KCTC 13174]|uniref:Oligo-1,6-glucosidase n=2 Tax=Ligilactobacillus pobuzihii TaxID=449659 RepID=A0A0R2L280_9LACO|nr:oligo-1,6-glucosidase [Ligilactobacillus pobuzihii E100301 = KCTC 13174]KRN95819.1 oligo-1,6-glucosidase [Ligilactobacillus pobuzihii]